MSVKSPVCIERYSLLNMPQNNRKQRKINTKCWILLDKTRNYTHISDIILKLALWKIWICNNLEKQLLLLYAHFVIAGHKCDIPGNFWCTRYRTLVHASLGTKGSWNFLILSWKSHGILRFRKSTNPVKQNNSSPWWLEPWATILPETKSREI